MKEKDVAKLVKLSWSGDARAFAQLVEPLWEQLYRTAHSYLGNEADSLDATQAALEKAFLKLKQLQEPALFKTWLVRILINQCCDTLKKRRREVLVSRDYGVKAEGIDLETKLDLHAAIGKLRPQHRQVIAFRYVHGYTLKEIAQLLDCPPGTIQSRHYYAMRELRKLYWGENSNEMY